MNHVRKWRNDVTSSGKVRVSFCYDVHPAPSVPEVCDSEKIRKFSRLEIIIDILSSGNPFTKTVYYHHHHYHHRIIIIKYHSVLHNQIFKIFSAYCYVESTVYIVLTLLNLNSVMFSVLFSKCKLSTYENVNIEAPNIWYFIVKLFLMVFFVAARWGQKLTIPRNWSIKDKFPKMKSRFSELYLKL